MRSARATALRMLWKATITCASGASAAGAASQSRIRCTLARGAPCTRSAVKMCHVVKARSSLPLPPLRSAAACARLVAGLTKTTQQTASTAMIVLLGTLARSLVPRLLSPARLVGSQPQFVPLSARKRSLVLGLLKERRRRIRVQQVLCIVVQTANVQPLVSGRFSNSSGMQFNCYPCPAGSLCSAPGASQFGTCPIGSYCPEKSAEPTGCPPGASESLRSCSVQDFTAGRFGERAGLSSVACSGPSRAGYWTSTGSTSAMQFDCGSPSHYCPEGVRLPLPTIPDGFAGTGADPAHWTNYSRCEPGSFCVGGLSTHCTPGRFSNRSQATHCDPCPLGAVTHEVGSSRCKPCEPGQYRSEIAGIQCLQCFPGSFSASNGSSSCE